jgi:hypothetical protein
MTRYSSEYSRIFDYLSMQDYPTSIEPAVVFGRKDPIVAHKLGDLVIAELVEIAVISGGIGKDSGNLLESGYDSEAGFLAKQLRDDANDRNYSIPKLILDRKASNGRENAKNSLALLTKEATDIKNITVVAHATSSLRLAETLRFEAAKKATNGNIPIIHVAPSAYDFDASDFKDQNEAISELLRLADWSNTNSLFLRDDIPEELVEFARDMHGKIPEPIKPWQSAIFNALPKKLQSRVAQIGAKNQHK